MITQERLKEVLDYNPDSGIFRWIESAGNVPAGAEAGTSTDEGYIQIRIDGRGYLAHRLAVLYTDGYLPELTVDHVDRVPWHNWRLNLREASNQCQSRNCGMSKNNTSGVKGVYWDAWNGKWRAQIMIDGRQKNLGGYNTVLDAAYIRFAAEQCLGFQDCDLNSSAKKYIEEHGKVTEW